MNRTPSPAHVANSSGHPRIAYVVCPSYHGATLLSLLLNNHTRISALGDTNPSREYDQTCACGEKVSECSFWQTVAQGVDAERFTGLTTMLPNLPRPVSNRTLEGGRVAISSNAVVNRMAGRTAAAATDLLDAVMWRRESDAVSEYVGVWESFYRLVSDVHGTSVVVDGSKSSRRPPIIARSLNGAAPVRVIHVVRDPRGFVTSSLRYQPRADTRALAWLWADQHRRIEQLSRHLPYIRVRYEDLADRTEQELARLFSFLDVPREDVMAPPRFPYKHHLMGNAMLFTFDGTVSPDQRWRTTLPAAEQGRVLRYAGGFARRCGYD